MEKARIKAAHKAECLQVLAYEAFPGLKLSTIDRALIVDLRFVFTPRHSVQMDKDNIIAACKTSLDSLTGIVWVDDKQVDIGSATQIVEREPGLLEWLEITIREAV
jgi:Holliday junction resolvase RusA-like endonuclease